MNNRTQKVVTEDVLTVNLFVRLLHNTIIQCSDTELNILKNAPSQGSGKVRGSTRKRHCNGNVVVLVF